MFVVNEAAQKSSLVFYLQHYFFARIESQIK